MSMGKLFNIEEIEQAAKAVDREERWFALEGRRFGEHSPMPLKVKVHSGGEAWTRSWTKGAQDYAKSLSPSERRRFAENSANPLTMDADALVKANRAAIRGSGMLVAVALVGPVVGDVDEKLDPVVAKSYGFDKLPASVRALYERMADGTWAIPLQAEPPQEFVASDEQVHRLLAFPDFVNQVANCRRILVDESLESEEEALGNSAGGSASSGLGES